MGDNLCIIMLLLLFLSITESATGKEFTNVNIRGTMLSAPECTVNKNDQIDVDFGDDVVISKIDGNEYKKIKLEYGIECISLAKQGLKLRIAGTPSPFDSNVFTTTVDGLGIRLLYNNVTQVIPSNNVQYFNFNYGEPVDFWAVLVVNNMSLLTNMSFTGTATMIIDYQ